MTTVCIWYEAHDGALWAVADTRISRGHADVLTDSGAKILPLTFRCCEPGASGDLDRITQLGSFGFTYAGSTLGALMTYTVVATCLPHLAGATNTPAIGLSEIAEMVRRIAERYTREIEGIFELAIFGWCPARQGYRVLVIEPDRSVVPLGMRIREDDPMRSAGFTLLGSEQPAMRAAIEQVQAELRGQSLQRAPILALRRLLRLRQEGPIGGALQMGRAHPSGQFLILGNAGLGDVPLARSYLGLNVETEIGQVGHYMVNIPMTL